MLDGPPGRQRPRTRRPGVFTTRARLVSHPLTARASAARRGYSKKKRQRHWHSARGSLSGLDICARTFEQFTREHGPRAAESRACLAELQEPAGVLGHVTMMRAFAPAPLTGMLDRAALQPTCPAQGQPPGSHRGHGTPRLRQRADSGASTPSSFATRHAKKQQIWTRTQIKNQWTYDADRVRDV